MFLANLKTWLVVIGGTIVTLLGLAVFNQRAGPKHATVMRMSPFELQQLVDRLELAVAVSATPSLLAFTISLVTLLLPVVAACWWLWRCERAWVGEAELVRALHACGLGDTAIFDVVRGRKPPASTIQSHRYESDPPVDYWEPHPYPDDDYFDDGYEQQFEPRRNERHHRAHRRQRHMNGR